VERLRLRGFKVERMNNLWGDALANGPVRPGPAASP
jgi:hypothetical protein